MCKDSNPQYKLTLVDVLLKMVKDGKLKEGEGVDIDNVDFIREFIYFRLVNNLYKLFKKAALMVLRDMTLVTIYHPQDEVTCSYLRETYNLGYGEKHYFKDGSLNPRCVCTKKDLHYVAVFEYEGRHILIGSTCFESIGGVKALLQYIPNLEDRIKQWHKAMNKMKKEKCKKCGVRKLTKPIKDYTYHAQQLGYCAMCSEKTNDKIACLQCNTMIDIETNDSGNLIHLKCEDCRNPEAKIKRDKLRDKLKEEMRLANIAYEKTILRCKGQGCNVIVTEAKPRCFKCYKKEVSVSYKFCDEDGCFESVYGKRKFCTDCGDIYIKCVKCGIRDHKQSFAACYDCNQKGKGITYYNGIEL
tara:strand:- start:320 stop:1390 length:1071 start_codon:yes stop_codon:yes gene_type:complete